MVLTDADGDGYTVAQGDCDDTNALVHPNATEIPGNDIDVDCNGKISCYVDADRDGYGSFQTTECYTATNGVADQSCSSTTADGCANNNKDCNDSDATIYPGAPEYCEDGVDQDCDGYDLTCAIDADGDGYTSDIDCNDTDANINPGVAEITCNGIDDDCDASTPDAPYSDGDGSSACVDCDDSDATVFPGATEICDEKDNNCDGVVDEGCNFADYAINVSTQSYEKGSYDIHLTFDCSLLNSDAQIICSNPNYNNGDIIGLNVLNEIGYQLIKTDDQINYNDPTGKHVTFITTSADQNYGTTMTRAYHFPPADPYTDTEATNLLTAKLTDIQLASSNINASENVNSYVLVVLAYDSSYGKPIESAWNNINASLKSNVFLYIVTTEGYDDFVYN